MLKKFLKWSAPKGVWFGIAIALGALFEQYYQAGVPVWSGAFGFPFLHHGYYGFIMLIVCLLIQEWYKRKDRKL